MGASPSDSRSMTANDAPTPPKSVGHHSLDAIQRDRESVGAHQLLGDRAQPVGDPPGLGLNLEEPRVVHGDRGLRREGPDHLALGLGDRDCLVLEARRRRRALRGPRRAVRPARRCRSRARAPAARRRDVVRRRNGRRNPQSRSDLASQLSPSASTSLHLGDIGPSGGRGHEPATGLIQQVDGGHARARRCVPSPRGSRRAPGRVEMRSPGAARGRGAH